jgi:hypothetical protein
MGRAVEEGSRAPLATRSRVFEQENILSKTAARPKNFSSPSHRRRTRTWASSSSGGRSRRPGWIVSSRLASALSTHCTAQAPGAPPLVLSAPGAEMALVRSCAGGRGKGLQVFDEMRVAYASAVRGPGASLLASHVSRSYIYSLVANDSIASSLQRLSPSFPGDWREGPTSAMTTTMSSAEFSAPQTPSPPRPPPARPAVSHAETLLRGVEGEIERSHAARRSSWVSPLRKLIRKATKKAKAGATASRNLLLTPPSPSRKLQEGREASKNSASEGQGLSSEFKKLSDASALDRSGYSAMMKCALKRIQAGDASDDAGAFAEIEQAMKGLMDVLFKEKVVPMLPRVFMSNLPCVDDVSTVPCL